MGLISQLRTTRLLRTNHPLGQESARFTTYLREAFLGPQVTAILSNYVHREDQDYRRSSVLAATDTAFNSAWITAEDAYEDSPEGDSQAHARFLALLNARAPYGTYAYKELLMQQHRKELVDRMIFLVRRG